MVDQDLEARSQMWPSHPDLEPASLGEVLDPLEGLVLLPVHIEPVHLQTTHRELTDCKLHTAKQMEK